jgi:NitT/TauT family transport system substrate-binding protein
MSAASRAAIERVPMTVRGAVHFAMPLVAAVVVCANPVGQVLAAETPINFTLDRAMDAASAPLLLALEKGDYKAAGVNVTISPAANSQEAIKRIVSGGYDMGLADLTAFIKFRDAHPKSPVKAVFVVTNRPPFAIIARKSRGIAEPKDLEGKRLGAPAADLSFAHWPIFVHTTGIDPMKVHVENIGAPLREPMLAAGQVDAITGLTFSSYIDLRRSGVPIDDIAVLPMADYGIALYGNAVIVNTAFAERHPDAVAGFLRALVQGMKQTARNPALAIDALFKHTDLSDKPAELERLNLLLRHNMITPEVRADGLGGIDATRFARAIDQIALNYKFQNGKPALADVFDPSFLPSAAERALH